METILIKAFQLICCLSLLVLLHEGGHFFFAKLFGVRVEKFYMFFNPYFHLFSTKDKWFTRLFPRFEKMETEYGIGWIPLGGYVSIAGMVDETKNAEDVARSSRPDDFSEKPVWQRFFIMFGGVLVNFLTALALYSIILFTWGQDQLPMKNITDGLAYNEQAREIGFRNGDLPEYIDATKIEYFTPDLYRDISRARKVTVRRNGELVDLRMPRQGINMIEMLENPRFFALNVPAVVAEVVDTMPAGIAGIQAGDRLVQMDGFPIANDMDVQIFLSRLVTENISVVVERQGALDTLAMQLNPEEKIMGVRWNTDHVQAYQTVHIDYSALECIPAGVALGWNTLCGYVNDLKYIPSKKGAQSVGSFITIGSIFPAAWDWMRFWMLTALISIILAVMNILPIPGLDGGHIVILIYEGITGRQPSPKSLEIVEKIGMYLLCGLMILALGNDIFKFIL